MSKFTTKAMMFEALIGAGAGHVLASSAHTAAHKETFMEEMKDIERKIETVFHVAEADAQKAAPLVAEVGQVASVVGAATGNKKLEEVGGVASQASIVLNAPTLAGTESLVTAVDPKAKVVVAEANTEVAKGEAVATQLAPVVNLVEAAAK